MKAKRLLGWILIILGLLLYVFFKKYNGGLIPYPFLFYILGFAMIITGFILLRKTPKKHDILILEKAKKIKQDLIDNGDKIVVNLNDCEIKENHFYEEPDYSKNYSDFELLNFNEIIMYNEMFKRNKNNNEIKQSVITAKINDFTFNSPILPFDKVKLLFEFDKQKSTNIYIDKTDKSKYYFDFDFLKNEK